MRAEPAGEYAERVTEGVFSTRYLCSPMRFGDWVLRWRIDIFQDRRSGEFFTTGEKQDTYLLAPVGGEPIPVTALVHDDFLIDNLRGRTADDLAEKIATAIGTHFTMDETERAGVLQAELVRQYRLHGADSSTGDEFDFEIDIFRDRSSSARFAAVARRVFCELVPLGESTPVRRRIWACDDALRNIDLESAAAKSDPLRLVIDRIVEHYALPAENGTILAREYQCLIAKTRAEATKISIDRRCGDGGLVASAEAMDYFDVRPIDFDSFGWATINTWVEADLSATGISEAVSRIRDRFAAQANPGP